MMAIAMSLDETAIDTYTKEFSDFLRSNRVWGNGMSFSPISPKKIKVDPVTVRITSDAYIKMLSLIFSNDKEIGWHGTVTRENGIFTITDIIVYPQIVSATLTDTDMKEYTKWLYSLPDKVFSNLRLHGHSHVNMSVHESSIDIDHWRGLAAQLEGDMYYIFLIMNKRCDYTIYIYDMASNTVYDKDDILVEILLPDGSCIDEYVINAEHQLSIPKHTPKETTNYIDPFDYSGSSDSLYQYLHSDFPKFMEEW